MRVARDRRRTLHRRYDQGSGERIFPLLCSFSITVVTFYPRRLLCCTPKGS